MGTGSWITDPLKNDKRNKIYEFLREHGTSELYQIKKGTGIDSDTTVKYHLEILKRKGLVSCQNGIKHSIKSL
jgi:predicted transcriptional regulator